MAETVAQNLIYFTQNISKQPKYGHTVNKLLQITVVHFP